MEEVEYIWMDGDLIPWKEAKVHVLTHALHYGTGVFEGIRAYDTDKGPAVFRLEEHMERFLNSCKIIHLPIEYTKDELMEAVEKLILKNDLDSCYIRPIAFRGYGQLGVNPLDCPVKIAIAVWPWGEYLGEGALKNGVEVQTSSWARHHPNISPTKSKATGNYLNSSLAKIEAIENGCVESIMLNPNGYVAEGTGENLFLVRRGELYTPQTADVLEGITCFSVMEIAADLDLEINIENITRDQIYIADEAFFTGTAAEVTPIRKIDGRKISDGIGPVTKKIQSIYLDAVEGRVERYRKWLHFIED